MGEEEASRKKTRNMLEKTFAKYEALEETPSIPRIEKKAAPVAEALPTPKIIKTGISGLDDLIGGGLPDRSLLLVLGEAGSHYTTFVEQVLYNHVLNNGKVAYYTTEFSSLDIQQEMMTFNWNLDPFLKKGSWTFISIRTPELQRLAELSPQSLTEGAIVNLSRSLNALKTDLLAKIKDGRWTAVHFSYLLHLFDLREIMDLMLYWRTVVRTYGGIHFIILPHGVHEDKAVNTIKHLTDGVFEFYMREGMREFEGILIARKMRRALRKPRIMSFLVTEDGILIETAARIA